MYIFVNSDIAIVFASLDSVLIRIASASGYDKEIELILCCDYTIPVYPHFCPPSITVSEWHSVRKTSHGNFCNLEHLRWLPSVNSLLKRVTQLEFVFQLTAVQQVTQLLSIKMQFALFTGWRIGSYLHSLENIQEGHVFLNWGITALNLTHRDMFIHTQAHT